MGANPFFRAYYQSDLFGAGIFIALFGLSIVSWTAILSQLIALQREGRSQVRFWHHFRAHSDRPLSLDIPSEALKISPLGEIYRSLRRQTLILLKKNRPSNGPESDLPPAHLTRGDLHLIGSEVDWSIQRLSDRRRGSLYLLSLTVTLAPFLGLLGTVWGILLSFGALQTTSAGPSGEGVLSGLSLALATTVFGLLVAIPALIGSALLRYFAGRAETQWGEFAHQLLASVAVHYSKVE